MWCVCMCHILYTIPTSQSFILGQMCTAPPVLQLPETIDIYTQISHWPLLFIRAMLLCYHHIGEEEPCFLTHINISQNWQVGSTSQALLYSNPHWLQGDTAIIMFTFLQLAQKWLCLESTFFHSLLGLVQFVTICLEPNYCHLQLYIFSCFM